ncbi:Copper amine oxidase 1 [Fusarium duplospermum]|uniref:Amine oxidase n=1 Tax=Fusarium duplospermum TaxID=1325734 RepID=A0A428PWX3_9HYPO|nr:Copper amine oxidase 1 [Fusarium duplospermum]
MARIPHPLSQLSLEETALARDVIRQTHPDTLLNFRVIFLLEPPKAEVEAYLELEHSGKLNASSQRPARLAQAWYDVIGSSRVPQYHETIVDLRTAIITEKKVVDATSQASLSTWEFDQLVKCVTENAEVQAKIADLKLPAGFEVVIEPWPFGAPDPRDGDDRLFQALMFAQRSGNPDSNFYAYPLPIIPVVNIHNLEVIRIETPTTGGQGDSLTEKTNYEGIIDHCNDAEYVPELLPGGTRQDLKPLTVVQPYGPSFKIDDGNLIRWQKWQLRVSFNPREGAVLHDLRYDGRSVLYRLSISDMTVPYADPRNPYHRKQAFDFGDGGLGNAVNNLTLGCDCLGVIKYFDGVLVDHEGKPQITKNVICLHEQDNGINWKHTNWRTGRAVVTRRRELVIQFIITLANYEYIFNFKLDQAAGIMVEARATGIVSVVNIDAGKTAPWGNVVNPGALAQNHQHVFCVRIDPSIDGSRNTVVQEESLPVAMNPYSNPQGNLYEVRQTPIAKSGGYDVEPLNNRVFKIQNTNKLNPVSGKPIAYKVITPATQKLLADPRSTQARRALFAKHHLWVTKHKDDEFYAGGRYTLLSKDEIGGVADAAARDDDVLNEDVVLWSCFGLTHNPRVEDWPVMPVEILQVSLTPADFFTGNPALDVPSNKDLGSRYAEACCKENKL